MGKAKVANDERWYHEHPNYHQALHLAKRLIYWQLVGDQWEADALSSWLVHPLAAALQAKPRSRRKRKP